MLCVTIHDSRRGMEILKNTIKIFLIVLQPFFFSSCFFGGGGSLFQTAQSGLVIGKSRLHEKKQGTTRTTISSKKESVSGTCEDSYECEDICEDTYGELDSNDEDEGRIKRCLDLSYKVVVSFEEIVKVLENPAYSQLQNIEANDFEEFLNVSLRPWEEFTRDFSSNESEKVLTWIAKDPQIAKAIIDAYKNYEDVQEYHGIERMLNDISGDLADFKVFTVGDDKDNARAECAVFCDSVVEVPISQGKAFDQIATDEGNNNLLEKVIMPMIREKCEKSTTSVHNLASLKHTPITFCEGMVKYVNKRRSSS